MDSLGHFTLQRCYVFRPFSLGPYLENLVHPIPIDAVSFVQIAILLNHVSRCTQISQALGTRAYEASRIDHSNGVPPLALGGGATNTGGHHGDEGLSADHQLLCQIGNCLQLDAVSANTACSLPFIV